MQTDREKKEILRKIFLKCLERGQREEKKRITKFATKFEFSDIYISRFKLENLKELKNLKKMSPAL